MTDGDVRRLAARFGVDADTARRRYAKRGPDPDEWVLRHRRDLLFQSACRFLDQEQRRCTIYEDRPQACRDYPGTGRCGYYDFLSAERRRQDDPELVLAAWVSEL